MHIYALYNLHKLRHMPYAIRHQTKPKLNQTTNAL